MEVISIILFVVNAAAILIVSRRWAPLALFMGCCYLNLPAFTVEVAGLHFPGFRLLLATSAVRLLVRHEMVLKRFNSADKLIIALSVWIFVASFSHQQAAGSGLQFALGSIYNIAGTYFLIRFWCHDIDEMDTTLAALTLLLAPIAVEMFVEKVSGRNLFAIFGGTDPTVGIRGSSLRARGPFSHPILAGSAGAACFPLMVSFWSRNARMSLIGMASCLIIVAASSSSGPVMSLFFSLFALYLWRHRNLVKQLVRLSIILYFALIPIMSRPPYFIMSRIDLAGGSTGWYRARLIQSSIEHLPEWWLFGTDYTAHWMATGVSSQHADLADYYILIGVWAGLPAVAILVALVWRCFRFVGDFSRLNVGEKRGETFTVWCLGASLFSLATTAVSVSYDGQTGIFFWTVMALISVAHSSLPIGGGISVPDPALVGSEAQESIFNSYVAKVGA